jgi:hypothetical protein
MPDLQSVADDYGREVGLFPEPTQSLIDLIEAESSTDAVFALVIEPPVAGPPIDSETPLLVALDRDGVRIYTFKEQDDLEAPRVITTRFKRLPDRTTLVLERRIDQASDRIVEPHELHIDAPPGPGVLRGRVNLLAYNHEERDALVDALTSLTS